MNKFDHIIFDLDGTLCDSIPDIHSSINYSLEQMDLTLVSENQVKKAIGPGPDVFSRIILGEDHLTRFDEFRVIFKPYYVARCTDKSKPFDGIFELLEQLSQFKLSVATNKGYTVTHTMLRDLDLLPYFDFVATRDCVERPKPEPDMILHTCAKLNVPVERTLLIGDTDNDILAAERAGVFSCVALWGYSDHFDELKKIADFSAASPKECLNIIKETAYAEK